MRRALRVLAIAGASAALVLVEPAHAQGPGPGPGPGAIGGGGIDVDFAALQAAKVGQWADYQMTISPMPKGMPDGPMPKVRYALVEKSAQKLSLEVDTTTPKGELDMRLDFSPAGADAWKLTAGKMKMADRAMDLPPQELAATPPLKKGDAPGDLIGTENVVTPVGTFACKHYRKVMPAPGGAPGQPAAAPQAIAMELWMSDKVAPTGLVKSSIGPMTITLSATGKGAEPKVK